MGSFGKKWFQPESSTVINTFFGLRFVSLRTLHRRVHHLLYRQFPAAL
jgi:hypothetical protein